MSCRAGARAVQKGFSLILALFLLVSLAGIGAFLLTISSLQQESITADEMGARAYQAARACIETAAYQALINPPPCPTPQTLTFTTGSLNGFYCAVTCTAAAPVTEGANTNLVVYRIVANGCNQATCPAAAGAVSPGYVNRELQLTLVK